MTAASATRTKAPAAAGEIADVHKRPEVAELAARVKSIDREIASVEAQIAAEHRPHQDAMARWVETKAKAVAEGRPEPPEPHPFVVPDALAERRRILVTARGMAMVALNGTADALGRALFNALLPERRRHFERIEAALAEAVAALADFESHLIAAGNAGAPVCWSDMRPVGPSEAEALLERHRRAKDFVLGTLRVEEA